LPRYFALHWPDKVHDDAGGTVLPDHNAAHVHAQRIIREFKEAGGYDNRDLTVRDHTGKTIHSISF
jgi:hypothetical protein